MKIVSIYIVNHNYCKYLENAILSVIKYSNDKRIELLLFDNGSTDNSRDIINKYNKYFDKVVFQENIGLTATCNKAIEISSGKYIMRLDADDFFDENGIENLLELIKKNDYDLCFGNYNIINEKGKFIKRILREGVEDNRVLHRPSHGACTLINKKFLLKYGGYYSIFDRQDGFDLWLKAVFFGKVGFTKKNIFNYRIHNSNLTRNWDSILLTRRNIKYYFFKKHINQMDRILYKINLIDIKFEKFDLIFFKEQLVDLNRSIGPNDNIYIETDDNDIKNFCLEFDILIDPKKIEFKKYINVEIMNPNSRFPRSSIIEGVISTYIFKSGVCFSAIEIKKDNLFQKSKNGVEKKYFPENIDKESEDLYYLTNDFFIRNYNFSDNSKTYVQIPENRF